MKFTDFHNSELAEASKTRNPTRDFLRNNPVSPDQMAKPVKQMSVPELATVSDEALDNAYHYGRSTPGNTFGWQANLKSAAYAKQLIDKGVTDIEQISDAIHKGWNVTARAFVQNPDQFDDTEKLKAAGKLEAKLQQRAKLMNIEYAQLPDDEQEKDRVVARALLQAIKGQQGVAEEVDQMDEAGIAIFTKKYKLQRDERKKKEKDKKELDRKITNGTAHIQQKYKEKGVAEGYWADAVKKAEADREARKGKPFEKNPASHDKDGVYIGDKDLAGNPVSKRKEPGVAEGNDGYDDESTRDEYMNLQSGNYVRDTQDSSGEVFIMRGQPDDRRVRIEDKDGRGWNIAPYRLVAVDPDDAAIGHYFNSMAEAKADPLGAWIAHKNGTEARKFKTREGAKKYVASHEGFTVSSSEAFHDTYRKKKVQEVKKFRTNYGWAGGSKEPRSAHAKQVAANRKEYEKGLGKFEPTDNMVGTAKIVRDIAMSNASPEHKKAAIDALNKKGVAEDSLNEFDPGEGGMPPFTVYVGDTLIDKFASYDEAQEEVEYQRGLDPRWFHDQWKIVNGIGETVWEYDVGEKSDDMRRQHKIQFIPRDNKDVAEGEKWIQKAVNSKTKGNLHKALHVPQDETIPKSRIAQAIYSADPHRRHMAQFAKNVAKEDAGGMGTGSVATSMGGGNGFANGGPGTITRRRK